MPHVERRACSPPPQQAEFLATRTQAVALSRREGDVAVRGLSPHEISWFVAVLAAVGPHMHKLVRERLWQVARSVSYPDRVGELGTGNGIAAADRFCVERRPVQRVVYEKHRRFVDRNGAQQFARYRG